MQHEKPLAENDECFLRKLICHCEITAAVRCLPNSFYLSAVAEITSLA
jgi:hypothetical protein